MQPTAIYNREIALSVGGYMIDGFREDKPRFRDYCEDLDLWTRMSDLYVENKAIVVVPEVLCKYRKHEQGLSASSFNMNIRMRHIKTNLLRRRAGEQELTFIDFYNSLSEKEIDKLKRDAIVGDLLRKGIMMIKQRKLIAGGYFVMKSIVMNPRYFYQKVKKNSGIFR